MTVSTFKRYSLIVCGLFILFLPASVHAEEEVHFSDNFESATLGSTPPNSDGWTIAGAGGWYTVNGTAANTLNHTQAGSKAMYSSGGNAGQGIGSWNAPGFGGFGAITNGRAEIWFYDDMAPVKRQWVAADNDNGWQWMAVMVRSPASSTTKYVYQGNAVPQTVSAIDRSLGWHKVEWVRDNVQTTLYLDGVELATQTLAQFNNFNDFDCGSFTWDNLNGNTGMWFDDAKVVRGQNQSRFRWYQNNSAETPTAMAAENTGISNVGSGNILRLRVQVQNDMSRAWAGAYVALRYREGLSGIWTGLGPSAHWNIADGMGGSGSPLANALLTSTNILQHFIESQPSSGINTVPSSQYGEWDFCLAPVWTNVTKGTVYYFKLVLVDGGGNYLSDLVSYPYLASAGVLAPKLWDGSTNNRWSNANNWTPAGVPVSGDDVVIPDGATTPRDPRLEMDAVGANSIRSLTVAVGGILNLTGGGSSLQIDENAIIYGTVDRSATVVNISGSAVIIGGTFSHDGSGDITAPNATMTINPGASYIMLGNNGNVTVKNLVVNGLFAQETRNNTLNALNITINPGGEYRNTRNTLTSLVNISGTFTNNGTMSNSMGGNFRFSGAAGVIDGSSISTRFYRLTLLGGTLSVSGSASPAFTTLDEGILLSAGTLNAAGRLIDNSGDWTNDGASLTGSGSLIRFTGGNAASLDNGSAQTIFQNLAVDKNPGVNLTAARALNIDGDFTIGSGNFIPGVYTHTVAGNWNDAGGGFAPSAGAIVLDGISPAVTTAAANNFFNLTIYTGGTASMGTSELDVNGALVIFSGAGLNCGSNTLNDIAGTTSAAGTLDMGTGTTNLRGPAVVTGTGRMILQTAGGAAPTVRIGTGAAMGSLTVGGIFQSAGSPLPILTDNGNQRYAFNIQNTATVNINGLNINRPNTGGLSIADGATITAIDNCTFTNGTAAGTTYLGLGQTSGTYTFSFCGFDANCLYNVSAPAGTESVTMNNASGAKGAAPAGEANDNDAGETHIAWTYSKQWDGSASTAWNNAANWTPAGVPVSTDAVVIPPGMPRQPLLNMNATGASRISSLTLASGATLNLNSASVYTLQIDGNSVFNGTVNLTTAAVNIGGAAVTIGGAFNHTGTGDLTTSGTMTVKPGAIYTMSGAGGNVSALNLIVGGLFLQQTGDNTLSIADLTINSGGEFRNTRVSAGSIVSISGILTNNGSMSGTTGGVFTFTGAASGIAGDVAPVFGTFALTGGATVISATPVPAVLILLDVVLNGGTLSAANKTIAVGRNWTNNGGSFTGSNSAVLLNTATAGVIDNGSAQTAFQNVTIAKSAGVGLSAGRSLNIDGNFTLSSGLFVPGAFTHTLAGNWNDNGGGFAPASGAIVLDGTSPSITTALINNFFNLTISSSGTAGMGSSELDVNGTLSVSTGATLNCGSNPGNDIAGITSLNGTLDMGTGITSLRGAVTVNSGGILRLSAGGSVLRLGSGATSGAITVSSGGTLTASGSPRPAITRQGTANYALTVVSGATLSIDGLNIDFPDANGLNIAGGAVVTMIDNCFFSNGIPAATTYLKFGNSTGSRTFNYCDFDANCLFNVSAPTGSAANLIYMFEATGAKGASPNGEANDNDPDGDNHINWTYGKQWVGITSTNWQVGSNWSPPSAPTSSDDVLISDQANDPVLPGAGGTARKITITNGVLTLGTNTLQVTGDFIIQSTGTLNAGTGTVVLNGPAGQIINANGKSFYNLAIGNSQDNTLQSDITVNGALQVNAGSGLTVAAGRTLTLTAGLNLNGTLEVNIHAQRAWLCVNP